MFSEDRFVGKTVMDVTTYLFRDLGESIVAW